MFVVYFRFRVRVRFMRVSIDLIIIIVHFHPVVLRAQSGCETGWKWA
jgi:hypothetical protein